MAIFEEEYFTWVCEQLEEKTHLESNGLQCGKHHSLHFHCCTSGCLIGTDPDIRHYYFVYCLKNCESICVKSKALEDTLNFLMFLKRYLGLEIEIFLTSQLQL